MPFDYSAFQLTNAHCCRTLLRLLPRNRIRVQCKPLVFQKHCVQRVSPCVRRTWETIVQAVGARCCFDRVGMKLHRRANMPIGAKIEMRNVEYRKPIGERQHFPGILEPCEFMQRWRTPVILVRDSFSWSTKVCRTATSGRRSPVPSAKLRPRSLSRRERSERILAAQMAHIGRTEDQLRCEFRVIRKVGEALAHHSLVRAKTAIDGSKVVAHTKHNDVRRLPSWPPPRVV
mmetsp:Transcript_17589/g.44248  ORF Transcript_17589/g.44248 Transcript_17589/m.44248 type:complete len:231 (+) Transcript_17589:97-789(+)